MSKVAVLIFPHQLFPDHPAIDHARSIYLVEEPLFFRQFRFHKKKLVLHRASMRCFADRLRSEGFTPIYIECTDPRADIRELLPMLAQDGIRTIHVVDPVDDWLSGRLRSGCERNGSHLVTHDNPNFINRMDDVDGFFRGRKGYFQTDFYVWQRKQRKILLEEGGGPVGGKWSFDTENRKRFPKNGVVPLLPFPKEGEHILEAREYVIRNFPENPGSMEGPDLFVTDARAAEAWLTVFLEQRLAQFGEFEDAIVAKEPVLFHSVLTPMLNIGLLNPRQIIDAALDAGAENGIPMNSLEGFIRQVMGWREFIRIVYEREGRKQRSRNFWGFSRKIPRSFWTGDTGIVPVDITIKKVLATGYCHHIERLMILGNFMLLCEFDPDEVYRWFMEMFIDAYDWVMVPNVYGMTQYADGGLMTTKPYISGSNYIMKMSDHAKGDWQAIWDGLFWRFMHVHREVFRGNPRWSMLLKTFDGMQADKRSAHIDIAEGFLAELDKSIS